MAANARPRWWGYHRLDSRWARRLVAQSGVRAGNLVLDVGAGHGAITAALVERGAKVVAVELHPERAAFLRERFSGAGVVVATADAADLRLPRRPFHVVANPPFAASTGLIRRLLAPGSRLVRADLVLPSHVARRWASASAPGASRWWVVFDVRIGFPIPPGALTPPPDVSITTLVIERRH